LAPERPRLHLIVPSGIDETALAAALAAGDVASIELAEPSPGLVRRGQSRDVAVLLRDDPARAIDLGADGVFLRQGIDVAGARRLVGADRIVGADGGASRHAAMAAAEAGADVIALDPALVAWWAELFEIPCLAVCRGVADVPGLVAAGADFLAVEGAVFAAPEGPAAAVAALDAAVDRAWAT
jgi:thiamine-phosphate pyrophosphorylase